MVIRMLIAALASFLIAAAFGRVYVPWLKKRGASQPLKEEVARIYEENEHDRLGSGEYEEADMPQGNASCRFLTGRAGELVCERENRTQDGREDAPDNGVFPSAIFAARPER